MRVAMFLKSFGIGKNSNQFPLLTIKTLMSLRKKVKEKTITVEDCEMIDHYMCSIGMEAHLEKLLQEDDVLSLDQIEDVFKYDDPDDLDDLTAINVTDSLLACIRLLRQRIYRGEKIY